MEGETVLENRRPGWSVWWKHIGAAAVITLLLLSTGTDGIVGGLVIGGGILAYVVIARMQSRYIVTDERVKTKVGLLSRVSREYRLEDIQSIATGQSVFERLLSLGSLTLRTASNDEMIWRGVPEFERVGNTIREQQREAR